MDTIEKIKDAIIGRLLGLGNRQVSINSDLFFMSCLLYPYTAPRVTEVSRDWESRCTNVIKKIYKDPLEVEEALTELKSIILREGREHGGIDYEKAESLGTEGESDF